jgi:Putative DNA-binding domain
MPITRIDFDRLSETELERLRENEVAEGIDLDYKRDLYAHSDKKEFLKDASSFANTAGGDIIIGMAENGGVPTELVGVDGNLDRETQRLESLLRDLMEPRIPGIRMRAVPLTNGRRAFVIRIPKSWNPPHAVLHNKSRLVFARNAAGVHEASVDEMRTMFTAGATLSERSREFQRQRMAEVHSGDGPFSNMPGDGRLVLHIIPFSAFGAENGLDLKRMRGQDLIPIWCSGCNDGYNVDGYWTSSGGNGRGGYVQVFRNGIIESAAGDVRAKTDEGLLVLYAEGVEDNIATKFEKYMSALSHAEVSPPMLVMLAGVRMVGTVVIGKPNAALIAKRPLRKSDLLLPVVTIEDYGGLEDYRQSLRPIFDAVWNAAGYEASRSYRPDGGWARLT